MSHRDRKTWLRRISPPAGYRPWPHGMPTSAAPLWIAIGLTPGGGNGETQKAVKDIENTLTFGRPAGIRPSKNNPGGDGLFWEKDTDYFKKVCSLFLKLGRLKDNRLSEDSCLALSGHLNLGTGQNGVGANAELEPQIIRWVSSLLANHFLPDVVVVFGWLGRLNEIGQYWNHANGLHVDWNSPATLVNFKADGKNYGFRIWMGKNKAGDAVKIIGWPNHPSRHPFTGGEKGVVEWKRALTEASLFLAAHN